MTHDVLFDRAGWGEHPRYTCLTCDITLLKKPYMTPVVWNTLVERFKREHSQELSKDSKRA